MYSDQARSTGLRNRKISRTSGTVARIRSITFGNEKYNGLDSPRTAQSSPPAK